MDQRGWVTGYAPNLTLCKLRPNPARAPNRAFAPCAIPTMTNWVVWCTWSSSALACGIRSRPTASTRDAGSRRRSRGARAGRAGVVMSRKRASRWVVGRLIGCRSIPARGWRTAGSRAIRADSVAGGWSGLALETIGCCSSSPRPS
jgi:hypothetical protein